MDKANIEFMKIAEDSYVVYKKGVRVTPIPISKKELHEKILEIDSENYGYEDCKND